MGQIEFEVDTVENLEKERDKLSGTVEELNKENEGLTKTVDGMVAEIVQLKNMINQLKHNNNTLLANFEKIKVIALTAGFEVAKIKGITKGVLSNQQNR